MRESDSKRQGLQAALGLALAARLLPFLYGWEHYGDAPVRIELAERWARAPHLWRGFLKAYQYGPLHLTLLGLLLEVLPDRFFAPRLLSLAAGMLSITVAARLREPLFVRLRFFDNSPLFVFNLLTGKT